MSKNEELKSAAQASASNPSQCAYCDETATVAILPLWHNLISVCQSHYEQVRGRRKRWCREDCHVTVGIEDPQPGDTRRCPHGRIFVYTPNPEGVAYPYSQWWPANRRQRRRHKKRHSQLEDTDGWPMRRGRQ